jgi:transposase
MLDQNTRAAILRLSEAGHGTRAIARVLGVSRGTVKTVLKSKTCEVPHLLRPEMAAALREDILELLKGCKGNLVRVHEELIARGATLSYPALTSFCRRHEIHHAPKPPAGHYDFPPGKEMQHDTSPHDAKIAGEWRRVQTAALVLCFSRLLFMQLYPTYTRFLAKVFLTEALQYFGGTAEECMIDNTGVIVLHGTGPDMFPAPEMAAFAERLGFIFKAHKVGDANRSARVEGHFNFIENNFYAGREFTSFEHANDEARKWCDEKNAAYSSKLKASRRDLFVHEAHLLKPLPIWVPEPYELHHRIVDIEGYVSVNSTRYSAPYKLIGRQVEVREGKDKIEVFEGPRLVATHNKCFDKKARVTLPEHRPPRGSGTHAQALLAEEHELLTAAPELEHYVNELKRRSYGRAVLPIRRMLKMLRDYPRASFLEAVRTADHYGLFDLDRLDSMVLKNVRRDFFSFDKPESEDFDD